MRIFKTPSFECWAVDEELSDRSLCAAIREIEAGLVDARLGGELIKKRVARVGGGKSGGYRTIIAYRQGNRAFFLHGFAKNERANVLPKEVMALKVFAKALMSMKPAELNTAVERRVLVEILCDV